MSEHESSEWTALDLEAAAAGTLDAETLEALLAYLEREGRLGELDALRAENARLLELHPPELMLARIAQKQTRQREKRKGGQMLGKTMWAKGALAAMIGGVLIGGVILNTTGDPVEVTPSTTPPARAVTAPIHGSPVGVRGDDMDALARECERSSRPTTCRAAGEAVLATIRTRAPLRVDGVDRPETIRAVALFERGCEVPLSGELMPEEEAARLESCLLGSTTILSMEDRSRDEVAINRLRSGCEDGHVESCAHFGTTLYFGRELRRTMTTSAATKQPLGARREGFMALREACEGGSGMGCCHVVQILDEDPEMHSDTLEDVTFYFDEAKRLGFAMCIRTR